MKGLTQGHLTNQCQIFLKEPNFLVLKLKMERPEAGPPEGPRGRISIRGLSQHRPCAGRGTSPAGHSMHGCERAAEVPAFTALPFQEGQALNKDMNSTVVAVGQGLHRAQGGGPEEGTSWTPRLTEELEPTKHRPGETAWEGAEEERPGIF